MASIRKPFRCRAEHEHTHAHVEASARETEIPGSHPVRLLMREHDVILGVLAAMEGRLTLLGQGEMQDEFWRDAIDFLRFFADQRHHAKEEDLLFPAMVEAGVPEEGGPIQVMKHEHEEGRALVRAMRAALDAHDAASLGRAACDFIELLREHIEKENTVLFPFAVSVLQGGSVACLQERFAHADEVSDRDPAGRKAVDFGRSLA